MEGKEAVGMASDFEPARGHTVDGICYFEVDAQDFQPHTQGSLTLSGVTSDLESSGEARRRTWAGTVKVACLPSNGAARMLELPCPKETSRYGSDGILRDLNASPLPGPFLSCPAHSFIFDLATGSCLSEPRSRCGPARVYDVSADEEGRIYVSIAPKEPRDPSIARERVNEVQLRLMERGLEA
ncbi:hypothetical protein GUITHDRAFT_144043 [Guillardia theta CCMP2712]|uniref:Rieske domain-containing protein n=1 Tax=Guillardia theta (strain CCMP2712) TaxID=905079 RepID=L1IRB5_GUITC|nr:hypothetical protein GUITHDRAFT_144043 [Guillardia theta CCMP2712]EKX38647.1 hypothetical protein GUITHDRAFT_144043 [Guillardia theta CCMP2712]|eukprot:XP_005825627.1 hypothetical protein GUITHDRAFT_144043 [Guillardia theta CCMP2712]